LYLKVHEYCQSVRKSDQNSRIEHVGSHEEVLQLKEETIYLKEKSVQLKVEIQFVKLKIESVKEMFVFLTMEVVSVKIQYGSV